MRPFGSGPYTSATSGASTGGPGGTSTTFTSRHDALPIVRPTLAQPRAIAWLCAIALVLFDQVHLQVSQFAAAAQVVLAHQPVEVHRRGGPRVSLSLSPPATSSRPAPIRAARARSSSGVPSGMSTTTWNSDLLSNGSIFITTAARHQPDRDHDQPSDAGTADRGCARSPTRIEERRITRRRTVEPRAIARPRRLCCDAG